MNRQAAGSTIDISRIKEIVMECGGNKWALIPVIQKIQNEFGYIPPEAVAVIAKGLKIFPSQVQGVISFYAQFYTKPRGRQVVTVCRGTACHVRGAESVLKFLEYRLGIQEGETTPDLEYTLDTVACIGVCTLAPNVVINSQVHGDMDLEKAKELFKKGES